MFSRFGGGIHPPEHKSITEDLKFINLPIPHTCYIPLQQHVGAPAKLAVTGRRPRLRGPAYRARRRPDQRQCPFVDPREGGRYRRRCRRCTGRSNPSSSRLRDLFPRPPCRRRPATGRRSPAINCWTGSGRPASWVSAAPRFPTAVKLSPPPEKKIDTLIVNGAECEPYLTVDDMLMKTFPDAVIEGTRIAMNALGVSTAVIGVESNKRRGDRRAEKIDCRALACRKAFV